MASLSNFSPAVICVPIGLFDQHAANEWQSKVVLDSITPSAGWGSSSIGKHLHVGTRTGNERAHSGSQQDPSVATRWPQGPPFRLFDVQPLNRIKRAETSWFDHFACSAKCQATEINNWPTSFTILSGSTQVTGKENSGWQVARDAANIRSSGIDPDESGYRLPYKPYR